MAAGFGLLRLSPVAFWSMTPRELAAAVRGLGGVTAALAPLTRGEFANLTLRFPDITRGDR